MFNVVHWVAWPTTGAATANTLWFNVTDYQQQNQPVWLPYQRVAAESQAGNGSRFGFQTYQAPVDLNSWAWQVSTFNSWTDAINKIWSTPHSPGD